MLSIGTTAGVAIWTLSMMRRPSGPSTADTSVTAPDVAGGAVAAGERGEAAAADGCSARAASKLLLRPRSMVDAAREMAACVPTRACEQLSRHVFTKLRAPISL